MLIFLIPICSTCYQVIILNAVQCSTVQYVGEDCPLPSRISTRMSFLLILRLIITVFSNRKISIRKIVNQRMVMV